MNPELKRALHRQLFGKQPGSVYAVLDGASVEGLLNKLFELAPEHCCLYRGELEPDMAEVAPYLVRLEPESKFTDWVLEEGWGNHWGVFASAETNLATLRRHFRRFLMVYDPEGKPLYFRYYDPRVLRVYLPTCNGDETRLLFGLVTLFALEGEERETLLRFWPGDEAPRREDVRLASP